MPRGEKRRDEGQQAARSLLKKAVIACFALSFLNSLLMLTVPVYMMQVYDSVLLTRSHETLISLTGVALAALVLFGVLDAVRSKILARAGHWLEAGIAPELARRHLEDAAVAGKVDFDGGRDLAAVRGFLASPAVNAVFDLPMTPLFLIMLFLFHPALGGVALIAAVLLGGLAVLNDFSTRRPAKAAGKLAAQARAQAKAGRDNARAIDGMGMVSRLMERWWTAFSTAQQENLRATERGSAMSAASKVLRLIAQVAILATGAVLVLDEVVTPGVMIAASLVMARALSPLEQAIGGWRNGIAAISAYRRIRRTLKRPARRPEDMKLPHPQGRLTLDAVEYILPGAERPLLAGISAEIEPGTAVALIGRTGTGKSTLARLIVGIDKPSRGAIRLDGADIFKWPRDQITNCIGYLPQEPELVGQTVADTIGRLDADADDVVAAAQLAGAHEMILALPNGYRTSLENGGYRLSGGQRQLIGLARAIYRHPPVIVLDEADAHLDALGTAALARTVNNLRDAGCTVVLVGHRMSTINLADRVLLIDQGRIVSDGRPEEVLRQPKLSLLESARSSTPISAAKS